MGSTPSLVRDLCKQYDNRSIWAGVGRDIQATVVLLPDCKFIHIKREANSIAQLASTKQQCVVMLVNARVKSGSLPYDPPVRPLPRGPTGTRGPHDSDPRQANPARLCMGNAKERCTGDCC
jgi:hypothetical protein